MPCVYYETEQEKEDRQKESLSTVTKPLIKKVKKYKKELDLSTRVACKLVKFLDKNKIKIQDEEIKAWAKQHKKQDKKRK